MILCSEASQFTWKLLPFRKSVTKNIKNVFFFFILFLFLQTPCLSYTGLAFSSAYPLVPWVFVLKVDFIVKAGQSFHSHRTRGLHSCPAVVNSLTA